MGTIKVRNSMDLVKAEDVKRWQEYTEELYKKDPDILECKVKWALGSTITNSAWWKWVQVLEF